MYDPKFIPGTKALKERIVSGALSHDQVGEVLGALEEWRNPKPHVFNVETTNICNMKCQMCPRTTLMTRSYSVIDDEIFEKVLQQVQRVSDADHQTLLDAVFESYGIAPWEKTENGFYFTVVSRCLILHGYGEPVLDKKIIERVERCTQLRIPTYFSCVPANMTAEKATKLMSAGLTVLKFSIDALDDEGMKKVRGDQNNFTEAFKTILDAIKIKEQNGFKTVIAPTMIALSEDSESREMHGRFLDMWKPYDVFAYVKSQDNRWYYEADSEMENKSHYASQYCEYPWTSLTVMADGHVVPCTQDYDVELRMGHVANASLDEVWNGEKFQELRRMHVSGEFPPNHKCNSRCDQKKIYQYLKKA